MQRGQEGYLMGLLIAVLFALAMGFILMNASTHVKDTVHIAAYYRLTDGISEGRSFSGIGTVCIQGVEFSQEEIVDMEKLKATTVVEILNFDNKCMEFLKIEDERWLKTKFPGVTDIRVTCDYLGIYRCLLECVNACEV